MVNLTSIHLCNIYGRIAQKSWKKMLLILAEYQKLCSPNTERYYALQFIYITKNVFILNIFWY